MKGGALGNRQTLVDIKENLLGDDFSKTYGPGVSAGGEMGNVIKGVQDMISDGPVGRNLFNMDIPLVNMRKVQVKV